jgi:hypothetical protein
VTVNIIITMYVVSAFKEDENREQKPVPAVGVWARKDRTD